MVELRPLDDTVFHDFLGLLEERGEAPEDFYRWKYLTQPSFGMPVGFVAFDEGRPVGCIGIVNRLFNNDKNEKAHVTWFADWYVTKARRSKGVGLSLLTKVASISPHGLGLPGPSKAANVAKLAGYEIDKSYSDYVFLCNPFKFGFKRFRSESTIKATIRGIVYAIMYHYNQATLDSCSLELIDANAFGRALSSCAGAGESTLIMDADFLGWMARIPALPNGTKEYWKCVNASNDGFAFGFIEEDYSELRKATVLFHNERALEKDFMNGLFSQLRSRDVHYIQLFTESVFKEKNDLRYYSENSLHLARRGMFRLNVFAIDRESIWFAQQAFN